MNSIKKSLEEATIINKGGYFYFVHPLADGIPSVEPRMLVEICNKILERINGEDIDKLVTVEAMGIPITTTLSLMTGIPMTIIRKREYGLDGEVLISQETGYSRGALYINAIEAGDKVLIIDDVISTGGTIKVIIDGIKDIGAEIIGTIIIIEKGNGRIELSQQGYDIISLFRIEVDERGVRMIDWR